MQDINSFEYDVDEEVFYQEEGEDDDEDIKVISQVHAEMVRRGSFYVSPLLRKELAQIRHLVLHKDRDWVGVVDGDEGSGKSVLAMQICKELDPDFYLNNIVFTADDFMDKIKKARKGQTILLDEGYSAANARASLSEVNRALVGLATEMRQKNLFVIIVLPSFFDLDKYFAIHRSRALFHVYFNQKGNRGQFVIFPKNSKKLLYLKGKKNYSYLDPKSPYPSMRFLNHYVVDETAYRELKANAFKKRTVSHRAQQWMNQRDVLITELFVEHQYTQDRIGNLFRKFGVKTMSQDMVSVVINKMLSRKSE